MIMAALQPNAKAAVGKLQSTKGRKHKYQFVDECAVMAGHSSNGLSSCGSSTSKHGNHYH
jgi:hypothetical protein